MPSPINKSETWCKRWTLEMLGHFVQKEEELVKVWINAKLLRTFLEHPAHFFYEWDLCVCVCAGILVCVPVFPVAWAGLTAMYCTGGLHTTEVSDYFYSCSAMTRFCTLEHNSRVSPGRRGEDLLTSRYTAMWMWREMLIRKNSPSSP